MENGSKDLFTLFMSYAASAMLEITGVCVREGKQRQTERAVIYKIKPYKLQLSTLPKAIFTGLLHLILTKYLGGTKCQEVDSHF